MIPNAGFQYWNPRLLFRRLRVTGRSGWHFLEGGISSLFRFLSLWRFRIFGEKATASSCRFPRMIVVKSGPENINPAVA
jgi:hypothetical protein